MSIEWSGITWAEPQYIKSFAVLGVAGIFLWRRFKRTRTAYKLLAGTQFERLIKNSSLSRHKVKNGLLVVGLFFLFLSLLHPQWNETKEKVAQKGRDLFIALDISRSMLATDCNPDRLTCAKEKIKHIVSSLSCERVGLILFSGASFVQCPLTADRDAFYMFLDQVDVELISSGTTALDKAVTTTINAFKRLPERKNKLLVMFTDGEDFSSNLRGVKREAQLQGLNIFTVGVGSPEGAPIPLYDKSGKQVGHQKDAHDKIVISRLNEGILHTLSQDVGGNYVRITQDNRDMDELVHYVQRYEKEHINDKSVSKKENQYPYFLLVSFFCFAYEWLL